MLVCKQTEVQEQWPIWIVSYLGSPSLGQCESALSTFELSMFGYKEKKYPLEYPPPPPQKTKRAGLRPVCVVMMRIESPGKMRSGATIGSRFLRMDLSGTCIQGGASDLWHLDIKGSALGDCPINVVGLFFCVYSSLSPCVWWRNPPPGEAGIGPDHHVMPGTDIGLGQPVD